MLEQDTRSPAVENYIKAIYLLHESEGKATTSLLSDRLHVTPASATLMVKRLAEDGIVTHRRYKGAELTDEGNKVALKIIRRHRLWELFLQKVLKFEWHELHEEAERLEHSTSDALEAKLDAYLGYPSVDPHGHIIPGANGMMNANTSIALSEIADRACVTVACVNDDSAPVLKYAADMGIRIGTIITVNEKIEFDGSLRVAIDGVQKFISEKLARNIFVTSV